jgi:ABC-2 type transport system ATP-binding protein
MFGKRQVAAYTFWLALFSTTLLPQAMLPPLSINRLEAVASCPAPPTIMKPMIQVQGLSKRFGSVQAVASVDFEVEAGELYGFLGPNGAGKTTTIQMLTGLARPDTGSIVIGGIDCSRKPKAAQHLMGVVPDESNLYPELSGYENLCFCGGLYGMPKVERAARARQLLQLFQLEPAASRKFGGYSKGMKRKLTIAAGVIHSPKILFLDEPTTGIDVASARQIRQLISDLNQSGTTIFLTTHYLEEAERLCQRIAFLVNGRIVKIAPVDELLSHAAGRHIVEFAVGRASSNLCATAKAAIPGLECAPTAEDRLRVTSKQPLRIAPLVRLFEEQGADVTEARVIRPSLEEVFVEITGIGADVMSREQERRSHAGGGQ